MLSRIAASRRHFTHRSDGNRKQLKSAERASEREKERSSVRTLDRYIPPESLSAFTLPASSLRWWCDHKPERVWWWCCVCVRARVCLLLLWRIGLCGRSFLCNESQSRGSLPRIVPVYVSVGCGGCALDNFTRESLTTRRLFVY